MRRRKGFFHLLFTVPCIRKRVRGLATNRKGLSVPNVLLLLSVVSPKRKKGKTFDDD